MTITNTQHFNRSLVNKKIDRFYVSFYKLPENISNILGRQVESFERPSPTFSPNDIRYKGVDQKSVATMEFQELSIIFKDDNSSFVNTAIYTQLYRQTGQIPVPSFDDAKFDINVKCFDGQNNINEEFTIINCFIMSVSHNENIYSDATDNKVTVTIGFDTVDYKLVDIPDAII